MHNMNGGEYDIKIKNTIADVHYNTKIPTLSSGSLQQHYKLICRLNLANLVSSVSIIVAVRRLQVCLRYAVN